MSPNPVRLVLLLEEEMRTLTNTRSTSVQRVRHPGEIRTAEEEDLGLLASRTMTKMHFCCWSLAVCGILLWRPELTNTATSTHGSWSVSVPKCGRFQWHTSSIHYAPLELENWPKKWQRQPRVTGHIQQGPDLNLRLTLIAYLLISTPYCRSWWEAAFLRSSRHHQSTWASVSVFFIPTCPNLTQDSAPWGNWGSSVLTVSASECLLQTLSHSVVWGMM